MRIGIHQLLQARCVAQDHVVGQQHRTGLAADQRPGLVDSVTQAQRILLLNPGHVHLVAERVDFLQDLEQVSPAALAQVELQLQ